MVTCEDYTNVAFDDFRLDCSWIFHRKIPIAKCLLATIVIVSVIAIAKIDFISPSDSKACLDNETYNLIESILDLKLSQMKTELKQEMETMKIAMKTELKEISNVTIDAMKDPLKTELESTVEAMKVPLQTELESTVEA